MHTADAAGLPPDSIRVLHLTIGVARGGRRDAILTLAKYGRQEGLNPFLATLRTPQGTMAEVPPVFDATADLGIPGRPSWRDLLNLRNFCRSHAIDVVHTHDAASQFVASLQHIVGRPPRIIMTFHRSLSMESTGWRAKLRNAVSLPGVAKVITASKERRTHFLSENLVSARKVEVIPLGIDINQFRPRPEQRDAVRDEAGVPEGHLMLVSMGHYGEEKGLHLVIEAVAMASQDHAVPPMTLVVLGTGSEERQAFLRELGRARLGDRIRLMGQRPDPERYLAAADLMVHLPRLEAFGLAPVQAMATGLSVIAAGVGGLPEVINPPEGGVLVPAGDIDAAAAAIRHFATRPEARAETGRSARGRVVREYDAGVYAARHATLYRSVLGRDTPAPAGL